MSGTSARPPQLQAASGNPVRDGYQGTTTPYKIENGKVVTIDLAGSICGHDIQAR